MREIEMEGVLYRQNVPTGKDPDKLFFVQVDKMKCPACGVCEEVCATGAIQFSNAEGVYHVVDPAACINCGQCLINCPYGAIYEDVSFVDEIFQKLKDPDTVVVSMPAPAVRYGLGECFGYATGTYVGGKMHAALRKLGFDIINDNQWAADVTIMEEGTELIQRVQEQGKPNARPLPQITSCCPGWIKFVESFYPDLIPNLSSCKSPIGMLGTLSKTYGAQIRKVDAKKLYTVSIMPCVAKKYEGLRQEMNASGFRDIDATITTRELAYMIKKAGIDFAALPDEKPDRELGKSTGGATIFGNSGGVMEAALRLAYEVLSGEKLKDPYIKAVRAHSGVKEASVTIPNFGDIKVCVISGLVNTIPVLEQIRKGESPYVFIEVMTCPGGCVNGGGQPLFPGIRASLFRNAIARVNQRYRMRTIG